MSTLTLEQKRVKHEQARCMLKRKLVHLPNKLFLNNQKPTLFHIIYETAQCELLAGVPREFNLVWYFNNYNKLAAMEFKARKFNHNEKEQQELNRDRVCDTSGTSSFRTGYRFAWLEALDCDHSYESTASQDGFISIWARNDWDAITWSDSQMRRLKRSIEQLRTVIPPMPFPIEDFWVESDLQPAAMREKNAALWAIRWLVHIDDQAKAKYDEVNAQVANSALHQHEFAQQMEAFGEEEHAELEYLDDSLVMENSHLLSALMTGIDENVEMLPKQEHTAWMNPSTAIDMIEGKVAGVSMDELIGHMVAMGLAEKEERMDTTS
ncbi:hypothetical protein PMIN07_011071 [Paraphaeosphaeria minitans]